MLLLPQVLRSLPLLVEEVFSVNPAAQIDSLRARVYNAREKIRTTSATLAFNLLDCRSLSVATGLVLALLLWLQAHTAAVLKNTAAV